MFKVEKKSLKMRMCIITTRFDVLRNIIRTFSWWVRESHESSSSVGVISRANIEEHRIIGRVSISQSSSIWPDHWNIPHFLYEKISEVVKSEHSTGDDAKLQIYSKLEKRQHIYTQSIDIGELISKAVRWILSRIPIWIHIEFGLQFDFICMEKKDEDFCLICK